MVSGRRSAEGEGRRIAGESDNRGCRLRRYLPHAVLVVAAAVGVVWLLGGCGGSPVTAGGAPVELPHPQEAPAPTSPAPLESSPTRPVSTALAPASEWLPAPEAISDVLVDAADTASGLQLYAPSEVPAGTRIAAHWSDVLAVSAPSDTTATGANPRVSGTGATAEVTLVLEIGGGRLSFMQNVHGDLGDLPGRPVGTVAGHLATAYRMLGAEVVQWEDAGRWYAVLGTGLAPNDIERFALSMRPL